VIIKLLTDTFSQPLRKVEPKQLLEKVAQKTLVQAFLKVAQNNFCFPFCKTGKVDPKCFGFTFL
jgi:hypothetical protein